MTHYNIDYLTFINLQKPLFFHIFTIAIDVLCDIFVTLP